MSYNIHSAAIIKPASDTSSELIRDGALVVGSGGRIEYKGGFKKAKRMFPESPVIHYKYSVILPGFIDLHTHLPQLPAAGFGKGSLQEWLESYIFPLESKYSDDEYALKQSRIFFDEAQKFGSTALVIYCPPYKKAADIAFAAAADSGTRAFIGNSLMDIAAPEELLQKPDEAIKEAAALASKWHGAAGGKLNYVVTPRYAGACSGRLLKKAADFAKSENLFIQTHLAENMNEFEYVGKFHPGAKNYSEIYEKAGLLYDKSILAHCIYLGPGEVELLKDKGSKIAHCPTSNSYLQSGIMSAAEYKAKGLSIGLGTDVAGGYSLSMMNEMKNAMEFSKLWKAYNPGSAQQPLSPEEVFYMATLGAAKILGFSSIGGSLEKGKTADFSVFNGREALNPEYGIGPGEVLSKLIYSESCREAIKVFIGGKVVYEREN